MRDDWSTLRKLMFQRMAAGGRLIEDTVTGNPAVFQTNVAKPLSGFTIPFLPVQQGTGDPSPDNVRPIIGWEGVTAFGAGENVFDADEWIKLGVNGTKYAVGENCMVTVKENDASSIGNRLIPLVPGAMYSYYRDSNFSDIRIFSSSSSSIEDKVNQRFTVPADGKVAIKFYANNYPTTGQFALVAGTEPPANCAPYTGQSYPVIFPAQGKNLLNPEWLSFSGQSTTVNGITFTKNADGSFTASGTSTASAQIRFNVTGQFSGDYYICDDQLTGLDADIYVYNNTKGERVKKWDGETGSDALTPSRAKAEVKLNDGDSIFLCLRVYNGRTINNITFKPMLVRGTETNFAYEPYTNTIYGGTVYPLDGRMLVEWVKEYANERGWTVSQSGNAYQWGHQPCVWNSDDYAQYCTHWKNPTSFYNDGSVFVNSNGAMYIGSSYWNNVGITPTPETVAQYLQEQAQSNTPLEICAKLSTPYEIPLDPLSINTLIGDNTIWTDTNGSNTIKYKKKG